MVPLQTTLITILRDHAERAPASDFVTLVKGEDRQKVTYGELWSASQSIGGALARMGIRRGGLVIIMLRHDVALYETFMGVMALGAVPSFMPYPTPKQKPDLFWEAHRALFARIEPQAIIAYDEIARSVAEVSPASTRILVVDELRTMPGEAPAPPTDADAIAFLQHSSGTTGLKKGVTLSHRAVLTQIESYAPVIDFDRESVITSWLPLYHDMGLIACFMLPLVVGARVVHLDPFEWVSAPTSLLNEVETNRATHSWSPNFGFNHLANMAGRPGQQRRDLSSLKAFINCSEPCKADSMRTFARAFADWGLRAEAPQVCYAMAESVFAATQTSLAISFRTRCVSRAGLLDHVARDPDNLSDTQELVSCGRPIPQTQIRIASEEQDHLPDGHVGEVCISGPSLYDGYFMLPELTRTKLIDGWHHTGDLGFIIDGELFITGRRDDLIIVRGRNYYAHDLESIVNDTAGVKAGRTIVFDVDVGALGTSEVICLYELEGSIAAVEVRRAIKARVESLSGLVLSRVIDVPQGALRKTTSGKISREANRKAFSNQHFTAKEANHV